MIMYQLEIRLSAVSNSGKTIYSTVYFISSDKKRTEIVTIGEVNQGKINRSGIEQYPVKSMKGTEADKFYEKEIGGKRYSEFAYPFFMVNIDFPETLDLLPEEITKQEIKEAEEAKEARRLSEYHSKKGAEFDWPENLGWDMATWIDKKGRFCWETDDEGYPKKFIDFTIEKEILMDDLQEGDVYVVVKDIDVFGGVYQVFKKDKLILNLKKGSLLELPDKHCKLICKVALREPDKWLSSKRPFSEKFFCKEYRARLYRMIKEYGTDHIMVSLARGLVIAGSFPPRSDTLAEYINPRNKQLWDRFKKRYKKLKELDTISASIIKEILELYQECCK
jgi:hypothetical protein